MVGGADLLHLCRWEPETGEQGLLPAANSLTTAGAPGQVSGDTGEKAPLHRFTGRVTGTAVRREPVADPSLAPIPGPGLTPPAPTPPAGAG